MVPICYTKFTNFTCEFQEKVKLQPDGPYYFKYMA
jgi:hypothetical protein